MLADPGEAPDALRDTARPWAVVMAIPLDPRECYVRLEHVKVAPNKLSRPVKHGE